MAAAFCRLGSPQTPTPHPPSAAAILSTRFLSSTVFTSNPSLSPTRTNPLRPLLPSFPASASYYDRFRFRFRAASPGQREPGPPSEEGRLRGIGSSLSRVQDKVQIFFAVLFWMSLFFWASAWDGRNRPNKGSRFRR